MFIKSLKRLNYRSAFDNIAGNNGWYFDNQNNDFFQYSDIDRGSLNSGYFALDFGCIVFVFLQKPFVVFLFAAAFRDIWYIDIHQSERYRKMHKHTMILKLKSVKIVSYSDYALFNKLLNIDLMYLFEFIN